MGKGPQLTMWQSTPSQRTSNFFYITNNTSEVLWSQTQTCHAKTSQSSSEPANQPIRPPTINFYQPQTLMFEQWQPTDKCTIWSFPRSYFTLEVKRQHTRKFNHHYQHFSQGVAKHHNFQPIVHKRKLKTCRCHNNMLHTQITQAEPSLLKFPTAKTY